MVEVTKRDVKNLKGNEICYGDYTNPPIPEGYTYVSGEWNNKFTIRDNKGNLLTWIPVGATKEGFCRRNWSEDDSPEKMGFTCEYYDTDVYIQTIEMLEEFGGVYYSTYLLSKVDGKVLSVPNTEPLTDIKYAEAYKVAQELGADVNATSSHLITAEEADTLNAYLNEFGFADFEEMKNNEVVKWQLENKRSKPVILTGEDIETGGIYGWFGTKRQWSQESAGKYCKVTRCGTANGRGFPHPLNARDKNYVDEQSKNIAVRAVVLVHK